MLMNVFSKLHPQIEIINNVLSNTEYVLIQKDFMKKKFIIKYNGTPLTSTKDIKNYISWQLKHYAKYIFFYYNILIGVTENYYNIKYDFEQDNNKHLFLSQECYFILSSFLKKKKENYTTTAVDIHHTPVTFIADILYDPMVINLINKNPELTKQVRTYMESYSIYFRFINIISEVYKVYNDANGPFLIEKLKRSLTDTENKDTSKIITFNVSNLSKKTISKIIFLLNEGNSYYADTVHSFIINANVGDLQKKISNLNSNINTENNEKK